MAIARSFRDWTRSEKISKLSANAERLLVRLMMRADDYGNFYANTSLIRSECFPLATAMRETDIGFALQELSPAIIRFYEADDKVFIHIIDFRQRLRWPTRKFPVCPFELLVKEKSSKKEKEVEVEVEREVVVESSDHNAIDVKNQCLNFCLENYKKYWKKETQDFRMAASHCGADVEKISEIFDLKVKPAIIKELELFWAFNDSKEVPINKRFLKLHLWLLRKK